MTHCGKISTGHYDPWRFFAHLPGLLPALFMAPFPTPDEELLTEPATPSEDLIAAVRWAPI